MRKPQTHFYPAGFSRGVPIIGQPKPEEPPAGVYCYQVPVLVLRDGEPLTADSVEFRFTRPLDGAAYKAMPGEIAAHMKALKPHLTEPTIVVLLPFFLGFVSQEAIDRAAANGNGETVEE